MSLSSIIWYWLWFCAAGKVTACFCCISHTLHTKKHIHPLTARVRIVAGGRGLGELNPQLYYQPPRLMLLEVPQGVGHNLPLTMINVNKCMGYCTLQTSVYFRSLYTNSSFRSCMKASALIGLPLVLLLGSFGPTWHLVGTSYKSTIVLCGNDRQTNRQKNKYGQNCCLHKSSSIAVSTPFPLPPANNN